MEAVCGLLIAVLTGAASWCGGNSLGCRRFSDCPSACYRSTEGSALAHVQPVRQLQGELTANRQIGARSGRAVRKIEAGAIPPKGGAQWDIAASAVLLV